MKLFIDLDVTKMDDLALGALSCEVSNEFGKRSVLKSVKKRRKYTHSKEFIKKKSYKTVEQVYHKNKLKPTVL